MPLILNGDGSVGPLSATEVGYLDGVTSAVQTQIDSKSSESSQGLYSVFPSTVSSSGGSASISNKTTTFSGVSSVSLNNCFSSQYIFHEVVYAITGGSANADIYARFRNSGTDISAGNYNTAGVSIADGTVSAINNGNDTKIFIGNINTNEPNNSYGRIHCKMNNRISYQVNFTGTASSTLARSGFLGGFYWATGFADGITLYSSTGTFSGIIRVYSYKNS